MGKSFDATFRFPSNFNVETTKPLDNRLVVDSVANLTDGSISYAYEGLIVAVKGSASLYICTELNDDQKTAKTWKEIKSGESVEGDISSLQTLLNNSIKGVQGQLDTAKSEHDTHIAGVQGQITGVQTQLGGVQTQLEGVQTNIETKHGEDIAGVQAQFTKGIQDLKSELIGSGELEETLDTITEISTWIKGHQGEYNSLLELQASGVQGVQGQLEGVQKTIEGQLKGLKDTVEGDVSTKIAGVQTQLEGVQSNLEKQHAADITGVQGQITGVQTHLEGVQTQLGNVQTSIETKHASDIAGVQGQITGVQTQVGGVQTQLEGVQKSIDAQLKDLKDTVDGDVSTKLAGVQTQLSGVQSNLEKQHAADIAGVQGQINTLEDTHKVDIVGIQTQMDAGLQSLKKELIGSDTLIDTLDTITEISTWIKGHQGEYNSLLELQASGVQGVQGQLEGVQRSIESKHAADIAGVQGQISGVQGEVKTLSDKHDSDVEKLEEGIQSSTLFVTSAAADWKTDAVGGLPADTLPAAFEGKTISEVLDMILWPTKPGSITQPSVTINYGGKSTNGQTLVYAAGTNLPASTAFTCTAYRGTSTYGNMDGTTEYTGEVSNESTTMNPNNFGGLAAEQRYVVTYKADFAAGKDLKNNKGAVSTNAKYAGGTLSTTTTFDCVYPIYVNTGTISTMSPQTLKDYIAGIVTFDVTIPEETSDNKFEFHVPSTVQVTSVIKYNDAASKWGEEQFPVKQDGTINYGDVQYKKYVKDGSSVDGVSRYEIKVKK